MGLPADACSYDGKRALVVGAALTDTFDTPGTKARFGLEPDPPAR